MFRRLFIWCLALAVLIGNIVACADRKSEKGTVKNKSELVAAEYGFAVLEDVAPSQFAVKDLEIVSFLNGGERSVTGKEMRERAVILKANLGLADAKRLLDNRAEIPVEFRSNILVFPGTLLRDSGGNLRIAYLDWYGGRWYLYFYWFGSGFFGRDRLVRCK